MTEKSRLVLVFAASRPRLSWSDALQLQNVDRGLNGGRAAELIRPDFIQRDVEPSRDGTQS